GDDSRRHRAHRSARSHPQRLRRRRRRARARGRRRRAGRCLRTVRGRALRDQGERAGRGPAADHGLRAAVRSPRRPRRLPGDAPEAGGLRGGRGDEPLRIRHPAHHRTPARRSDPQSVGRHPHARRVLRRLGGGGLGRDGARRPRQRRWGLAPHPGRLLRTDRPQAEPRPDLAGAGLGRQLPRGGGSTHAHGRRHRGAARRALRLRGRRRHVGAAAGRAVRRGRPPRSRPPAGGGHHRELPRRACAAGRRAGAAGGRRTARRPRPRGGRGVSAASRPRAARSVPDRLRPQHRAGDRRGRGHRRPAVDARRHRAALERRAGTGRRGAVARLPGRQGGAGAPRPRRGHLLRNPRPTAHAHAGAPAAADRRAPRLRGAPAGGPRPLGGLCAVHGPRQRDRTAGHQRSARARLRGPAALDPARRASSGRGAPAAGRRPARDPLPVDAAAPARGGTAARLRSVVKAGIELAARRV
ncbi:MAG: Aspartyl-tRNA(Asn) amidotransferase subunit A @ Glutamyl-tRNA(Gln) amidotransferase subunit A, partial [uncultured Solirubrobacteraceae bacterium]